jgi:hypothetical protein
MTQRDQRLIQLVKRDRRAGGHRTIARFDQRAIPISPAFRTMGTRPPTPGCRACGCARGRDGGAGKVRRCISCLSSRPAHSIGRARCRSVHRAEPRSIGSGVHHRAMKLNEIESEVRADRPNSSRTPNLWSTARRCFGRSDGRAFRARNRRPASEVRMDIRDSRSDGRGQGFRPPRQSPPR